MTVVTFATLDLSYWFRGRVVFKDLQDVITTLLSLDNTTLHTILESFRDKSYRKGGDKIKQEFKTLMEIYD